MSRAIRSGSYSGVMSCGTCGSKSLTAACFNKGCAPPPVGKGGSSKGPASRNARLGALKNRQKIVQETKARVERTGRMPRGAAKQLEKARRRVAGASGMKSNKARRDRSTEARMLGQGSRQTWQKVTGGDKRQGGGTADLPFDTVRRGLQERQDRINATKQSAAKRRSTETVNLPGGGRARADQANRSSALSTRKSTGAQKPRQSVAQRKRKMMLDSAAEEAGAAPRKARPGTPGRGLFGK